MFKQNNLNANLIPPINYTRHCKQVHLPCELVGLSRDCQTKEFKEIKERSCFKGRSQFKSVLKLSKKTKEM